MNMNSTSVEQLEIAKETNQTVHAEWRVLAQKN